MLLIDRIKGRVKTKKGRKERKKQGQGTCLLKKVCVEEEEGKKELAN